MVNFCDLLLSCRIDVVLNDFSSDFGAFEDGNANFLLLACVIPAVFSESKKIKLAGGCEKSDF